MEVSIRSTNKKPQIVVVTGASAGLGRAIVREYARKRCHIALLARDPERLETTRNEVESLGGKALIFPIDVANHDEVESAAKSIEKELGPIDIWINNAMTSVFSPAKEMNAEEYKRVTDVTYLGYVYGTLAALKYMIPRNRGIIVQVGSALAYRGIPFQSAYCAAKHAVQGFSESVRAELIQEKSAIKITMVQLPAMNTPHFNWVKNRLPRKPQPVPPIFQPEVAAKAIVWATEHYRREWYVGWSTIVAIVGDKIASGFGDWYLAKTAYKSQQYDGAANPHQKNNLFKTVSGNFGAHGDFDKRASSRCISFWFSKYRNWILFLIVAALIAFFHNTRS